MCWNSAGLLVVSCHLSYFQAPSLLPRLAGWQEQWVLAVAFWEVRYSWCICYDCGPVILQAEFWMNEWMERLFRDMTETHEIPSFRDTLRTCFFSFPLEMEDSTHSVFQSSMEFLNASILQYPFFFGASKCSVKKFDFVCTDVNFSICHECCFTILIGGFKMQRIKT